MKKIITTLFLIFLIQGIAYADSAWIQNPDNGHWYKRIDTEVTWQSAKAYAESLDMGAYLATITSQEENDFVWNNLGSSDPTKNF